MTDTASATPVVVDQGGASSHRPFGSGDRMAAKKRRAASSLAGAGRLVARRFVIAIIVLAMLTVFATLAIAGLSVWALKDLTLERSEHQDGRPALLLEAADGTALGRIGPMKVADAERADFPNHLLQAVLSVEDRRFYNHYGIDPIGMLRAARRNLAVGEIMEGGSTITQQLVKNLYLGNDRTYTRKLREALASIWLERRLDKDEILTRYLNSIYLGAGAHGVPAAARLYFDKRPDELSLQESAMLAGLIRAPSQYNPVRNLETARNRAEVVLDAMDEAGFIDSATAAKAKASPATVNRTAEVVPAGSWFADWVAREVTDVLGASARSVKVRTTLDPRLQRLAEEVVADVMEGDGRRSAARQAALIALRPDGAVLAMVGGLDYRSSQFNRAIEPNRHPGSAFKLFVYLAALRNGFAPHDTIDAGPVQIKNWQPANYGGQNYGRVTLAQGFAQSINTAAVRLALDVGLDEVIRAARDLGIEAPLPPVPSMALGAVEVSLLEMTGAFASARAGRTRVKPWGIAGIGVDEQRPLRTMGAPLGGQPLGAPHEALIDLLQRVVDRGTGRAAAINGFAGGKTGTSQNHRDAWFVGFNESLVVGVWIGNDDNTPMKKVVGGSLPAVIWKRFVSAATPLLDRDQTATAGALLIQDSQEPTKFTPVTNANEDSDSERAASMTVAEAGRCDYRVCASAYRSFQPSDCTYQPYRGPRRRCELGRSVRRIDVPEGELVPARETRAQARCNIDVCASFYRSFDPATCTYQPYSGGPRRQCER